METQSVEVAVMRNMITCVRVSDVERATTTDHLHLGRLLDRLAAEDCSGHHCKVEASVAARERRSERRTAWDRDESYHAHLVDSGEESAEGQTRR